MANVGMFAGNFLTAFSQAKQMAEQKKEQEEERKVRTKLFEIQLKQAQAAAAAGDAQQKARQDFLSRIGTTNGEIRSDGAAPKGLLDLLADPESAKLALTGGVVSADDLLKQGNQRAQQDMLRSLTGGGSGGAPPGFEVSGIKLDTSGNPMIDLSRSGEVARWMTSADGRMQIGVDKMGRPVKSMPAGPDSRAPEDVPLTPDRLSEMRTQDGKMLPPGTTLRQAQQMGASTSPKPGEADKKSAMLLKGMQDAEIAIEGMSGTDTSSMFNAALSKTPVSEIFTSAPYRKYETAAKRWAQNYLYLKSGAQASEKEVTTTFHTFFPQPGDSEDVKAQKKRMREQEAANVAGTYSPAGAPGQVVDFNSLPK